jgi:hypothetical protein
MALKVLEKYGGLEPVYHEFYKVYEIGKKEKYPVTPRMLLVEDSNAGYEFFESVAKEKGLQCFSANGKSNIYNWLCDNTIENELLIIADGAAFGSQMNRIEIFINKDSRIHLYLPESFEWLLLSANLFRKTYIDDVLENTADYIDYSDYFSWEQFFTATIMDVSKDTYLSYSKKKLNPNYLQGNIKWKILETIKNVFF